MSRRAFLLALCLIGLVGLAVRTGYLVTKQWDHPLEGDAFFYHETANLLAEGKGYIDPFRYTQGLHGTYQVPTSDGRTVTVTVDQPAGVEQPTAAHPPAWTVVLAGFSKLGMDSQNSHRLAGVLVGTLGVVAIGLAGREWAGSRVGLVSAAVASVYGFLWLNDAAAMSESLVTVLVPVTTIVALRFWRRPSWRLATLLGVLGAIGALTRGELLLFVPVVVLAALVKERRGWRPALGRAAVALGVLVVLVSPWVARNLTTFREPVLLGPTGTILSQTNCDATYYHPKLGYWELNCSPPAVVDAQGHLLDESQQDRVRRTAGLDYAKSHLARLAVVAVPARIGRMFNLYDPVQTARFDIYVEGRDFDLSIFSLVQYYVLVPFAVAGVVIARRRRLPLLVLLTWVGLVVFVAATTFGNNRYRVTAAPVLLWLSGLAFVALWDRYRRPPRTAASATTASTAIKPS